jgi:hypothetical protein
LHEGEDEDKEGNQKGGKIRPAEQGDKDPAAFFGLTG